MFNDDRGGPYKTFKMCLGRRNWTTFEMRTAPDIGHNSVSRDNVIDTFGRIIVRLQHCMRKLVPCLPLAAYWQGLYS